jgi:myo-inositol-1-phosphate synthase
MIKVAIAGIGNCASALLQALALARKGGLTGLMRPKVARWGPEDIEVVAGFDVDRRKVGLSVGLAALAAPNCTAVVEPDLTMHGAPVLMAPVLDGVAAHMADFPEDRSFRIAGAAPVDVAAALRQSGAEVLLCYLPVGSTAAVTNLAEAALAARVAFVNCVPVFIASDAHWARRFEEAGVPLIGDDVKSQLGATIVHRTLMALCESRGVNIKRSYQLNTGGNTDFLNMLARERLDAKKTSKTQAVQSSLVTPVDENDLHVGPSDYVPWQKDRKVCFLRIEGSGLGGSPIELELRLSVEDSPNSAAVVLDAIRCAKLALDAGVGGVLVGPSAAFMKSPPHQVHDIEAQQLCDAFIVETARSAERGKTVRGWR